MHAGMGHEQTFAHLFVGANDSDPARAVVCDLPDDLAIATGEPEMLLAALGVAFVALFDDPSAVPRRQ